MISVGTFLRVLEEAIRRKPNDGQGKAIEAAKSASLFIVARPGTGKTATLAMRMLKLIFVDGLTQLNTELTLSLGNQGERKEAICNASSDLFGFERELQVVSRGQAIASASYRDIPLLVQVPDFDAMEGL